jgi:hypothetical protein
MLWMIWFKASMTSPDQVFFQPYIWDIGYDIDNFVWLTVPNNKLEQLIIASMNSAGEAFSVS